MKNVFIFIPHNLNVSKSGYLEGFQKCFQDSEAFYVTNYMVFPSQDNIKNCIGYASQTGKNKFKEKNKISYSYVTQRITLDEDDYHITKIIYNYQQFKDSDIISEELDKYGEHFATLLEYLKMNYAESNKNNNKLYNTILGLLIFILNLPLKILSKIQPLLKYSSTLSHFEESTKTMQSVLNTIKVERKLSVQNGNILVAKLIDLCLGIFLMYYLLEYEDTILQCLQGSTDVIISNLRRILIYLMGSPIGLKLNYAFNRSLGTFFFYHISLWQVFLHGIQPFFIYYFRFLVLPLMLGLSFQIALLSDIILLATFHVYCIYVYGARMFYLQLRGIASLWRLFIGRKYNPLRQRVDSCKYNAPQLFMGTLGFTVLLFLLPTTTMYYAVFTLFRLGLLLIYGLLLKLRYLLKSLPVYIILLWILRSHTMAGALSIKLIKSQKENVLHLEAYMTILSLRTSIQKYLPGKVTNGHQEGNLGCSMFFRRLFTGTLL